MEEKFEISEEAKLDFHKAECYFRFLGKGEEFITDFENQLKIILKMPYAFQIRYGNIRIVGFEYFHYTIHYNVINNGITILRVLSQSQSY